ncbi:hypothetical protein RMS29_015490 [Agrobacterium rosae]|uniref:Uncharacterized protein n=1 Tax=Agrobacterium rosae TaxID=1972867 RepID=A0AAW9FTA4_9HYPH|nr:hypothetical protein [Agrobacterium rosae]MDX8305769.1 hypothetical protein [Agrobacterium rosae]MDX8333076.1 hypothetical protein [Agrobacterium rosae]
MHNSSALISELLRAANDPRKLSELEKSEILGRAAEMIEAMREKLSQYDRGLHDPAVTMQQLQQVCCNVTVIPEDLLRDVFLTSAQMIRNLRVMAMMRASECS